MPAAKGALRVWISQNVGNKRRGRAYPERRSSGEARVLSGREASMVGQAFWDQQGQPGMAITYENILADRPVTIEALLRAALPVADWIEQGRPEPQTYEPRRFFSETLTF